MRLLSPKVCVCQHTEGVSWYAVCYGAFVSLNHQRGHCSDFRKALILCRVWSHWEAEGPRDHIFCYPSLAISERRALLAPSEAGSVPYTRPAALRGHASPREEPAEESEAVSPRLLGFPVFTRAWLLTWTPGPGLLLHWFS